MKCNYNLARAIHFCEGGSLLGWKVSPTKVSGWTFFLKGAAKPKMRTNGTAIPLPTFTIKFRVGKYSMEHLGKVTLLKK